MNWTKIPEHENYEINEFGEVRFLGGVSVFKDGRTRYYPPRACKLIPTKHGYSVICDGDTLSVAKLVAVMFCPNPKGFKQFHHVDGDAFNNSATNIQWGLRERVIISTNGNDLTEKECLSTHYLITPDGAIIRKCDNAIIKPSTDVKGYLRVRLKLPAFSKNKDGRKPYKVHRLVAMFYLSDYSSDLQVNHKNGNKQDNRVENLEMVTASQNTLHAWRVLDSTERKQRLRERMKTIH